MPGVSKCLTRADTPGPGARHATVREAMEDADADGTRSILDMERIGTVPDCGVVTEAPSDLVLELFGILEPTREMVKQDLSIVAALERGQGMYVIVYRDGKPSEIFFAGLSYD
jgi:hypothetical protein